MKKLVHGCARRSFLLFTILFTLVGQNNLSSASITEYLTNFGASIGNHSLKLGKKACGLVPGSANKAIRFFTRPNMLKAEAVIASLLASYGLAKTAYNHVLLYGLEGRLALKRVPWYLRGFFAHSGEGKIYNWSIRNYPTASTILYPNGIIPIYEDGKPDWDQINQYQKSVIDNLISYFPQVVTTDYSEQTMPSQGYSQQLNMHNDYQPPYYYQQRRAKSIEQKMLDVIDEEINELRRELQIAESYLLFPSAKYDFTGGINEIIYDCCYQLCRDPKAAGAFFAAFNENGLTSAQEMQLDRSVKNIAKTKFIHWASARPNFGKAVNICWEIKRRIKRLQAIQGILVLS